MEIFRLIADDRWSDVIKWCSSYADEAFIEDQRSWTPLHYACQRQPPAEVVRAIIKSVGPGAVLVQTGSGMTPLHFAASFSGVPVVRALLEAAPSAATIRNNHNETPLQYVFRLQEHVFVGSIDRGLIQLQGSERADEVLREDFIGRELRCYWNKVSLLVEASYCGELQRSSPSRCKVYTLLHGCAGLGEDCPPCLLQLAAMLCPRMLKVADMDGNLPLHLALKACGKEAKDGGFDRRKSNLRCGSILFHDALRFLIKMYPWALRTPNRKGHLPLHLAAMVSALATDESRQEHCATIQILVDADPNACRVPDCEGCLPLHAALCSGKEFNTGGVRAILDAFQAAVMVRHRKSRLFPAMIAAAAGSVISPYSGTEMLSIDSTYELLRAWPEIDRFALQRYGECMVE